MIGQCRTFVAKYLINGNANFDFSVPVLVDVGGAFGFEIRFCDLKIIQFLKVTISQNFFSRGS